MDLDNIGTAGDVVAGSQASSAAHIEPDMNRVKKYDASYISDTCNAKKFRAIAGGFFGVGLLLVKFDKTVFAVILVVIGLLLFLLAKGFKQSADAVEGIFKDGLLCPGIVTEDPQIALVLADICFGKEDQKVYAVKKMNINTGDWTATLGSPMAFCAFFGSPDPEKEVFKVFGPKPVVWATADAAVATRCVNAIEKKELTMLEQILPDAASLAVDTLYVVHPQSEGRFSYDTIANY